MNPTSVQLSTLIYSEQVQPVIVEEPDETTMYIGYPLPSCVSFDDPKWLIKRVRDSVNGDAKVKTIMYPNGERAYNQRWSDRYDLTYKPTPNFRQ